MPPAEHQAPSRRQSLCYLKWCRSLTQGEGREHQPRMPTMKMHSNASDVGFGGALFFNMAAGSPGLWEAQCFWTTTPRAREPRAVRLLLVQSFAYYGSYPRTERVLLHEDNQAVVSILNSMVSVSHPMMSELRNLCCLLHVLVVEFDVLWVPSAVNRFADSFSRTWDPGDARSSQDLVQSIRHHYRLDQDFFPRFPMGENTPVRMKQMHT